MNDSEEGKLHILIYWLVLLVAVTGVSCAGAMFQQVDDVPPVLRASWRLQVTSLILLLPAVIQIINAENSLRSRIIEKSNLLILVASGCFVGAHFGCWVASLDLTTLTHSLLFVTAHPLVVVCGMFTLHRLHEPLIVPILKYFNKNGNEDDLEELSRRRVRDPSLMELLGASLGFVGAGITFLDVGATQGKHTVTAEGDGLAFLGAIFLVLYMACGRLLREWMPVFIYAFPVTLVGALVLLPISAALELEKFNILGAFGWYKTSTYLQWFFALALIAGLCGHTGMNMVLSRLSPLIICTAATTEPVIGSLLGWAIFESGAPSMWTYIGGSVLMLGLFLVVYGSSSATSTTNDEEPASDMNEKNNKCQMATEESSLVQDANSECDGGVREELEEGPVKRSALGITSNVM